MVEFAYMRVLNHLNSNYFSVVSHPTMVYNKVLVDGEFCDTIFSKFWGRKRKLLRNSFLFHKSVVVHPY